MAIKVGTLQVDLIANTASFTGPLDKAGPHARKTAQEIQGAFNGMDTSEARGGLMLIDDLIGVHMPRHAAAFVSEIPGFAAAFSAMFPLMAVVVAAKAIFEAVEAAKKHREALEKVRLEMLSNVDALAKHADQLHLDTLRLQDHIALLEGRPSKNRLAEELIKAKIAAGALNDELRKVGEQAIKDLEELKTGGFKSFFTGDESTSGKVEEARAKLRKLMEDSQKWKDAISSDQGDPGGKLKKNLTDSVAAVKTLGTEWKTATDKMVSDKVADMKQLVSFQNPEALAKGTSYEEEKHANARQMQKFLVSAAQETQSLITNSEENANALRKAGAAEALTAKIDFINKEFTETKKLTAAQTALIIAGYEVQFESRQITAGRLSELKQAALDREFSAERDHLAKVQALEAGRPQLVAQVGKEIQALEARHDAEVLKSYAETLKKQQELMRGFTSSVEAESNKQLQAAVANTLKEAEFRTKSNVKALVEATNVFKAEQEAAKQHTEAIGAIEAQQLQFERQMGMISETEYEARLQQEILKTYLAAQQELKMKRDAALAGSVERVKADAQLQALEDKQRLQGERAEQQSLLRRTAMFRQMMTEWQNIQHGLGQSFMQTMNGMNSSMSQFLVTGKGNWLQLGSSALQEIIKIGLQWVESKVIMSAAHHIHVLQVIAGNVLVAQSSAATAAANTLADAPWPDNIPAAVGVLAIGEAYAADASAARGALLPNRAMLVNTHPEEMILPRNISNFIVNAAGSSSGAGGGGDTHHFVFAPTVHAVDAQGVDRMLTQHADLFHRHIRSYLRRQNFA